MGFGGWLLLFWALINTGTAVMVTGVFMEGGMPFPALIAAYAAYGFMGYGPLVWYFRSRARKKAASIEKVRRDAWNAQERQRQAVIDAENSRIAALRAELENSASAARSHAAAIRDRGREAQLWMVRAATQFTDGAFAPFWDAAENTALCLAQYDQHVAALRDSLIRYERAEAALGLTHTPIGIDPESFVDVSATITRLKNIADRAQRDINFATIYQARQTNQLLAHGFANLTAAVDGLGCRIDSSLRGFASSLADSIESSSAENARALKASIDQGNVDAARTARDMLVMHERQGRVLRDIRHELSS